MQLEIKKYLLDIQNSILSIEEYLLIINNFKDFQDHKMLRRAVEREIEIIGEAVNNILKIETNFPLENARSIVNTRNLVIHAYDSVDEIIIWGIIKNHLPKLKEEVITLLKEN